MTDRDALLGGIAENPDDDARRLVFSDWLEEQGDAARAEFVRVQVALAAPKLAGKRRLSLREKERELLDAHRKEWIAEVGLPLEDVAFHRGLIAKARLPKLNRRKIPDPTRTPWLAGVEELDLSGLGLGDDVLAAFATKARLPALKKLLLNDNRITDAAPLLAATGLPRLGSLYLFGNDIKARAGFKKKTVDWGEPEEGYSLTPGQTDVARRQFVRLLLPLVSRQFTKHEHLISAALCVGQYWCDEAYDAVHARLVVSELPEPILEGVSDYEEGPDDPNIPRTPIKLEYSDRTSSVISLYDARIPWDDNDAAIPLWAAFAPEGGSQEYESLSECYAPAVMFNRDGGHEILPMLRPHLDGVQPEWEF